MVVWTYIQTFIRWLWRCARAWIEVGHRLETLETDLATLVSVRSAEDQRLDAALADSVATARAGRERLHLRIDELDRAQSARLTAIDAAQQERIDHWALQLSGQINQLYLAIAKSPMKTGDV